MLHLNDRCFYSCLWITPDLRCQKNVFGFCVFLRRQSKSEEAALSSLSCLSYILANLLGNKRSSFVICDWWISIRFVCFCVSRLDALFLKSFTLALRFFLSSLHWNMASLDSKSEIVPIELPNPEETEPRKGENEPVRSPWHLRLLTNTVDATAMVWLTSQKNLNLEHAQYELLRMSAEVPSSSRLI